MRHRQPFSTPDLDEDSLSASDPLLQSCPWCDFTTRDPRLSCCPACHLYLELGIGVAREPLQSVHDLKFNLPQ